MVLIGTAKCRSKNYYSHLREETHYSARHLVDKKGVLVLLNNF